MPRVKSISTSNDAYYDSVKAILHSTVEAVQARYGAVSLRSARDNCLRGYVSNGLFPNQGAGISVAQWVVDHGDSLILETREQILQIPDLITDPREQLPLICVPIWSNSTVLGALQSSFPSVAGHKELQQKQHILKLAADLIGYVIENVTLRHKFEETKELVRNARRISLEIQEAERERIILEIHDGVAQTLSSAFTYLQILESIGGFQDEYLRQVLLRTEALVTQAIDETKEIINIIPQSTLDSLGLVPTLQQVLKQYQGETGCQVDFQSATWPVLPQYMEHAIYRIIREAITNVRKHANSPRLRVELSQGQERLVIRVKDWGIGFIPTKQEPPLSRHSIGLFSMRRRADFLGGTFRIKSRLGKGTEILVEIPFPNNVG